ncbi:MAG: helix-turn-helix domain-containing protein [Saprospiraceae bacterium]|nr:helix-turn-helix domain-containing protein [Saprospiraceae bacterium]
MKKIKTRDYMASSIRINKICQHCGNEFIAKTTVTKYCGDNCAKRAYKARKKAEKIELNNQETQQIIEDSIIELQTKDFLSVAEVCQLFKVSRTTIWRLMKEGKVNAARIGRKKFITRASINALFKPPIEIKPKPVETEELQIETCWNIGEVERLFNLNSKTLYDAILRFDVPKIQQGKFVYVPKENIISIFGQPK